MNGFQVKVIKKADAAIREVNNGSRARHYMDEYQREFIGYLIRKPSSYDLTKNENHCLNMIMGKL